MEKTLRDEFAMAAMQAALASGKVEDMHAPELAAGSYKLATYMILEKEKWDSEEKKVTPAPVAPEDYINGH